MAEKLTIQTSELPPAAEAVYDPVLKFYKGEPWVSNNGNYFYDVPDIPYVHKTYIETPNQLVQQQRHLQPKNLLVAHGIRNEKGEWAFKDGRSVSQFIDTYNASNPSEPIEVAAVCNPTHEQHRSADHEVNALVSVSGFKEGNDTVVSVQVKDPMAGALLVPEA